MAYPATFTSWFDSWPGLHAVVLGLDEEGFALADTLVELGVSVSVFAEHDDPDRASILSVLGVDVATGPSAWSEVSSNHRPPDFVVVAASWSGAHDAPHWADDVVVWSEVEYTSRVSDKVEGGPEFVFVAGQHAELIAHTATTLLMAAGLKAFQAGVSLAPALDAIRLPDGIDVVVWVLTPAQLQHMEHDTDPTRQPVLSVSISDEHPLPHDLLVELYRNTSRACVYRRGGGATEAGVEDAEVIEGARAIGIGLDTPPRSDLGRVEDIICDRAFLEDRADRALELCTTDELEQAGFDTPERAEAAVAAFAIARAFDVAPELIGAAVTGSAPADE
jgi:UDP-N-acetylmuramoylalanine--D-glutamate ligase